MHQNRRRNVVKNVYRRKISLLISVFLQKHFNLRSISIFSLTMFFSILIFFITFTIYIYFFNQNKIIDSIDHIPEEFSIGLGVFYNKDSFRIKEDIFNKIVDSYKERKLRKFYIFVLNHGERILENSDIYTGFLKEIPKDNFQFIFKHANVFELCSKIDLTEISKFIAISDPNTLIQISTYCNLQNRYNMGLVATSSENSFDFLELLVQTLLSVVNLIVYNNFK